MASIAAVAAVVSGPVSAGPRADTDLAEALVSLLAAGGHDVGTSFDDSNTVIIPKDDPTAPLGWSNHAGPLGAIYLNIGKLQDYLDLLNELFGFGLTKETPEVIGFMAWVCTHELGHVNCCHKTGDNKEGSVEFACDEIQATIRAATFGCDLIEAVRAAGGPTSEEQARALHALCAKIQANVDDINSHPELIDMCVGLAANGYSPCRCTRFSWDPPQSDPCSSLPGVPPRRVAGQPVSRAQLRRLRQDLGATMKATAWILASLTLSACGWHLLSQRGLARSRPIAATSETRAPRAPEDESIGERLPTPPHYDSGRFAYLGNGMAQTISWESTPSGSRLIVRNRYPTSWIDGLLVEDPDESYSFPVPFEVSFVQAKTRDRFYGAGRLPNGEDVVVRWSRRLRSEALAAPGATGPYSLQRKELFRGALGVRAIGVDHEDRFLLLLHGAPTRLSRLELPEGGTPTTLFSSAQIPELEMPRAGVFPSRYVRDGLVWTVEDHTPFGRDEYVLFFDAADDGTIDSWRALDRHAYFAEYGPDDRTDSFLGD